MSERKPKERLEETIISDEKLIQGVVQVAKSIGESLLLHLERLLREGR